MCAPGCYHTICQTAVAAGLLAPDFELGTGPSHAPGGAVARASFGSIFDLSHTLHEGFPTYPGDPWFSRERFLAFEKDGWNMFRWTLMEHTGTHVDAPIHFSRDGLTADLIPVTDLFVPLAVIDIRARADAIPETTVTPQDIKAWEAAHGRLPEGCCVAMNSGWDRLVDTDRFTGRDGTGRYRAPGFHPETARMLIEERSVKGIAVDTLSLDPGTENSTYPTHYAWLPSGRWGLEGVANLGSVPASGAHLFVGMPKVKGATGGPARVVAFV